MKRHLPILVSIVTASPALAHAPAGNANSLSAGFLHPLFGADHVLAMVGVGLWAGVLGGRALPALPTAFVGAMIAGFALAIAGLPLLVVEPMILASVIVFGLAVALAVRPDLRLVACCVGCFALFHGYAHGAELGTSAAPRFGAGFVAATVLLHAIGIGLARLAPGQGPVLARAAGGATAAAGLLFALA